MRVFGLIARNSDLSCSPLLMLTGITRYGTPSSSSMTTTFQSFDLGGTRSCGISSTETDDARSRQIGDLGVAVSRLGQHFGGIGTERRRACKAVDRGLGEPCRRPRLAEPSGALVLGTR